MKWTIVVVMFSTLVLAQDFKLKNAQDAFEADQKKINTKAGDDCNEGVTCAGDAVGQCVNGKIVTTQCAGGLSCQVLPLVNKPGTSVACASNAEKIARLKANGLDVDASKINNSFGGENTIVRTDNRGLTNGDNNTNQDTTENSLNDEKTLTQQFKANDNECIDDTRFRKYTSATEFVIQSCPPGMCFTRNPPVKNTCVGRENAIRIDNKLARKMKRSLAPRILRNSWI